MNTFLDFEKPIAELEGKIKELRHLSDDGELNIVDEVTRLQSKAERLLKQTYSKLTPWQKTLVARHPDRPHFSDYIDALVASTAPWLNSESGFDHILFSYHGLPESHLTKADPTKGHCLQSADCCQKASEAHASCYRHQVFRTTECFVEKTGLFNQFH